MKVKELKECTVILTSLYSQTYNPSQRQKNKWKEERKKAQHHHRVSIGEAKQHSNIQSEFEQDMQEESDDLKQTE